MMETAYSNQGDSAAASSGNGDGSIKYINYADNLFILNTKIRSISDLLLLDAEPDFFLTKTLEDIEFIDRISELLFEKLQENSELVDREELFYAFYETETRFYNVLLSFEHGKACFSFEMFPEIAEKVTKIQKTSLERKKKLQDSMILSDKSNIESRVVSSAELSELLKGLEDS
jgi:hypothetical protein